MASMSPSKGGSSLAQSFLQNTATQTPNLPQIMQPQQAPLPQLPQPTDPEPTQGQEQQYVRMLNPQSHTNSITGMGAMTPIVGQWVPEDQVDMLRNRPGFWGVGNPPDQTIQSGPFAGINPQQPMQQSMQQPAWQPSQASLLARAINDKYR